MKKSVLTLILFATLLFSPLCVSAENSEGNSTDWRMNGRWLNGTRDFPTPFPTFRANNITYNFGVSGITATAAIGNGYIYVITGDSTLTQLNASNISQFITNVTLTGSFENQDLSPIVIGNWTYMVTRDANGGVVDQLNASNISQIYSNFTPEESIPVLGGPAVIGNSLFFQTALLYELNASNVTQKFTNNSVSSVGWSSPAIANNNLYLGGNGHIYQLNLSNTNQQLANYTIDGRFFSSALVANGYLYIGTNNSIIQLNASNISKFIANYTITGGLLRSTPALAYGSIYIGGGRNNTVYQLNASNISILIAHYVTEGAVHSSPAVGGGSLYIGSTDKKLYQLNATNISQRIGTYLTGGNITMSPILSRGYVYFGNINGTFYQILANNISDQISPSLTLSSPTNTTYTSLSIPITVSLNEEGTCTYNITGSVVNIFSSLDNANTTFSTQDPSLTSYTLQAYCLDNTGNFASNSVTFAVDSSSATSSTSSATTSSASIQSSGSTSYIYLSASPNAANTLALDRGDQYHLRLQEETHVITLNTFNVTHAKVTISSEPHVLFLEKGLTQETDVDNNGVDDLQLTYEGVEKAKAKITLAILTQSTPSESAAEQPLPLIQKIPSENEALPWKLFTFILLGLFVGMLTFFLRRN